MTTNNQNAIQERIFTVAYRNGTAILTDSKINVSGKGSLWTFKDESSLIAGMKAINYVLRNIPENVNFDNKVVLLLPESISYLGYEDTREYWITNNKTKQGKDITPEFMDQIKEMHDLLKTRKNSINIFNQNKVYKKSYITYKLTTWDILNKIVPKVIVSATSFDMQ